MRLSVPSAIVSVVLGILNNDIRELARIIFSLRG